MKRSLAIFVVLALLAATAHAAPIPKLEGRVNDFANVLTAAQRQQLEQLLVDEENRTSNQIAILTGRSLDGDTIEDFSLRAAEGWKLGQKSRDNGVLVVAAIQDHKMRIEVGKGLEGALTDAISSQIIRNEMAPKFRSGDFAGGLTAGVTAIGKAIRGEFKAIAPKHGKPADIGPVLFWMFVLAVFLLSHLRFGRYRNHWLGPYWYSGSSGGSFSSGGFSGGGFSSGGGGFSGGGGSFGGGGASGSW
jgi:uncharacterized protein